MFQTKIGKRCAGAAAIAMLFGAMSVYAQSTQNPSTNATGAQTGATTAAGQANQAATNAGRAAGAPLSKADQKLVTEMAQANLAEIEAARIAQGKTQNEQVKNFAQQMIDDHTKALQDVQQLAQAKGLTLPTGADTQHRRMAQRLNTLSGDAFDNRYMAESGVSDHKKTHKLLERVQSRAKDPDVRALAAKMLPTVDQHLNTVEELSAARTRGAGQATGTSGTSGASGAGGAKPAR